MRAFRLVLLVVLGTFLLAGCKGNADAAGSGSGSAARALNVRVAPVASRNVTYTVQAIGSLEADETVQVTAEVSGAVSQVLFQTGDHVTPSTVMARIDPDRYHLEAARAEAAHRRAVADWERSKADFVRREALAKDQLVSVEELNRVRQETERLAADVAAAKAALDIALQNQQRSEVRPARAGGISARSVDTGQFVQPGAVLATLVDTDRLRLRFKVSESESLKITEGQDVVFRVAALGARDFTAHVYHVGDVADPATRQVEVLGWVQNPGPLKPGFFAEVKLDTTTRSNATVVPEGAIQASERGFVAYVVTDGRASQRTLQLGSRTGDGAVEIVSGLTAGEIVVVEGSDRLADGIAVHAVGSEAEGNGSAGAQK